MSKKSDQTHKAAPPKAAKPKAPHIQQAPVDGHLLQLAREDPARLTPAQRTQLQRTLSNRALGQLVGNPSSVHSEKLKVKSEKSGLAGQNSPLATRHSPLTIQPKLTVNAVGDKYEQEADAVAKEVVQKLNAPQPDAAAGVPAAPPTHAQRQTEEEEPIAQRIQRQAAPEEEDMQLQRQEMPEEEEMQLQRQETGRRAVVGVPTVPPTLQRQSPEEEELQLQRQETEDEELQLQRQELEEEEPQEMAMLQREAAPEEEEMQLQRQEMPEEEEMQLQRQELDEEDPAQLAMIQRQPQDFTHGGPVDSRIEAQINQSRGGGRPMEDSIRQPMEQAFGADFSDVRIHTDGRAHNLNESIQARAFTTNNDIYFEEGGYSPTSSIGQELLAHELTHVLQQNEQLAISETNPGKQNGLSVLGTTKIQSKRKNEVAEAAKSFGKGVLSYGKFWWKGLKRTGRGLNVFNQDELVQISEENIRAFRLAKKLVKNIGVLSELASIVVEFLAPRLEEEVKKKISYKLRLFMIKFIAKTAGKKIIGILIAKKIVAPLVAKLASTETYKRVAKSLKVSSGTRSRGLGVLLTMLTIQGILEEASQASRRLESQFPKLHQVLKNRDLDMAWFLIEPQLESIKEMIIKEIIEYLKEEYIKSKLNEGDYPMPSDNKSYS